MSKQNYTEVVRQIVQKGLKAKPTTHKDYVLERIKVMIHHTDLHTKAVDKKRDCNDGIKNMQRGAQIVFSESWRQLKREFKMDDNGFIRMRPEVGPVVEHVSPKIEVKEEKPVAVFCLLSEADYLAAAEGVTDYAGYIRAFYALQLEALGKGFQAFTVLYDHDDFVRMRTFGKFGSTTGSEARATWAYHYYQDKIAGPRQAHDGQNRLRSVPDKVIAASP